MFSSLLSLFLLFSFFSRLFFPPPLAPSSPSPRLINYSNTNDEYIYISVTGSKHYGTGIIGVGIPNGHR